MGGHIRVSLVKASALEAREITEHFLKKGGMKIEDLLRRAGMKDRDVGRAATKFNAGCAVPKAVRLFIQQQVSM